MHVWSSPEMMIASLWQETNTEFGHRSQPYFGICCGIMHILHNFRNPRDTACTKCRAWESDRPLKNCHLDHLLWNHGSSLTFVRGPLTDHFSLENDQCSLHDRDDRRRSVMCTEEAYRRAYLGSYRTYRADMCTRLCRVIHMCRQTKSISVYAHVHKTDFPIDINKRHVRYFMDVIVSTPMRRGSSAELFLLLHIASNSSAHCTKQIKVMCIILRHTLDSESPHQNWKQTDHYSRWCDAFGIQNFTEHICVLIANEKRHIGRWLVNFWSKRMLRKDSVFS
jgi:hypothetical protein